MKIKLGNSNWLHREVWKQQCQAKTGISSHLQRWINENSCRIWLLISHIRNTQICLWTRYRDIIQLFQVLISVVFHGAKNNNDTELSILCEVLYSHSSHNPMKYNLLLAPVYKWEALTLIISCISLELLHKDGCPSIIPFDPPNRSQGSERCSDLTLVTQSAVTRSEQKPSSEFKPTCAFQWNIWVQWYRVVPLFWRFIINWVSDFNWKSVKME